MSEEISENNVSADANQTVESDQSAQPDESVVETNGNSSMPGAVGAAVVENGSTEKEEEDERKLFVGGLSHGTNEEMLRQHFSTFGEVLKVELKYDPETKKSRNFGFITFSTSQGLKSTLEEGSHTINGKLIDPKKAQAKPKPPPNKKVFVGGLSSDVPEETIREHFGVHGKIEKIELPIDKVANKRRQFCFVVYETEAAAKTAVQQNRQMIGNMTKECDVKLATPPQPKDGAAGGGRYGFPATSRFNQAGASGGARGRGRGSFQSQAGWNNQPYQYNYGYNQGYQGSNYDYAGYGGGYGGGYDGYNNWSSYGQQSGYGQQNSGYGKIKRGAGSGSQGYHPYSQ